jgi:predicted amidophosphoribosyltransferase
MAICPNCGNKTGEGAVFCDQCGARLPQPETAVPEATAAPAGGSVICPACGAGNVPGEAFCDYCGSPLDAPAPTVQEAAPPEAEAEPEAAAVAEGKAPVEDTCPACGAPVLPGEAFCPNCGASLAQPPIPPEPVAAEEEAPALAAVPEAEAVPEPEAELPAEAEPEAAAEAGPTAPGTTCPACGAEVEPGDAFCSTCGYALQEPAAPQPEAVEAAVSPPPPAGPRLVVSASGAEIPLPEKDEILIGREDPVSGVYPDVDLTPHGGEEGGVSRRHARLIAEGGKYYVEDLDSTNFTFVNKQKVAPQARQEVGEGDNIRFGRVEVALRTG